MHSRALKEQVDIMTRRAARAGYSLEELPSELRDGLERVVVIARPLSEFRTEVGERGEERLVKQKSFAAEYCRFDLEGRQQAYTACYLGVMEHLQPTA